jgi:hypothetical protein
MAFDRLAVRMSREQRMAYIAAADRDGLLLTTWILNTLDKAAQPLEPIITQAVQRWQTIGHPKACGCAHCQQ